MPVFLDVGSHEGQTLEAVVGGFDMVYSFEPMPDQYQVLVDRFGGRSDVTLFNYGLADFTGDRDLFGSNVGMEASLFADKRDVDRAVTTRCHFVAASSFFRQWIPQEGDGVVMKLNCEGCEVCVMNDLLDSGEASKISNVMIDFDVRKIPSEASGEAQLLARMREVGFDRFSLCEEVMQGETHGDRIVAWLKTLRPGLWQR